MEQFFTLYLKLFFMLTPFFVLSIFLTLGKRLNKVEKKAVITKLGITVFVASMVFLLFGKYIFSLFGITLDAFKVGAGVVLFLSALDMIRNDAEVPETEASKGPDFAVVPLAIPTAVGPGMIGILMLIGAEITGIGNILLVISSLVSAILSLLVVLLMANKIQQLLGTQGLEILPKITGLFVAAIGAQIVFSGVHGLLV